MCCDSTQVELIKTMLKIAIAFEKEFNAMLAPTYIVKVVKNILGL